MALLIRDLLEAYTKSANQIQFLLQESEAKSRIEEKYTVYFDLKNVMVELEKTIKKIEKEFDVSDNNIKAEYKNRLVNIKNQYKTFEKEFVKCEKLLKELDNKENENIYVLNNIKNLPDIGLSNHHSLYYSQKMTILNNAQKTHNFAKDFIKDFEMKMKTAPLIDKDQSYFHYKNSNLGILTLKKATKNKIAKYTVITLVSLLVVMAVIAFFYVNLGGGHDVDSFENSINNKNNITNLI